MKTFEELSSRLDSYSVKVPCFGKWDWRDANLTGYRRDLEVVLGYLRAEKVYSSIWHTYAWRTDFVPVKSPYLRSDLLKELRKLGLDPTSFSSTIALGFDEGGDYPPNSRMELMFWINNHEALAI
jgi:hypothetical protein